MQRFCVYIFRSLKDGKRYVGCTKALDRRCFEHARGMVKSTRNRRPLELIYVEEFDSKEEARVREKFFKTGSGRAYLKGRGL